MEIIRADENEQPGREQSQVLSQLGSTFMVFRALDSELRRELLRILAKEPKDSIGCYEELANIGFIARHRETIYKELQILVEANLVEKFYDIKTKKILYKTAFESVSINLNSMKAEFNKSK